MGGDISKLPITKKRQPTTIGIRAHKKILAHRDSEIDSLRRQCEGLSSCLDKSKDRNMRLQERNADLRLEVHAANTGDQGRKISAFVRGLLVGFIIGIVFAFVAAWYMLP